MCGGQDHPCDHLRGQPQSSPPSRRDGDGEYHVLGCGHAALRFHHQRGLAHGPCGWQLLAPLNLCIHHGRPLRLRPVPHHHPRPNSDCEPAATASATATSGGAALHVRPPAEASRVDGRAAGVTAVPPAAAVDGRDSHCGDHDRSKLHRRLGRRHHVRHGSSRDYQRR